MAEPSEEGDIKFPTEDSHEGGDHIPESGCQQPGTNPNEAPNGNNRTSFCSKYTATNSVNPPTPKSRAAASQPPQQPLHRNIFMTEYVVTR